MLRATLTERPFVLTQCRSDVSHDPVEGAKLITESQNGWIATRERQPPDGQEVAVRTLFNVERQATFRASPSPHWDPPYSDDPEAFPYWRPVDPTLLAERGFS